MEKRMTRLLRVLEAEFAFFSLLGLRQLYAYVPVGNVASRKLFTSAGYTECGILKDWIRVGTSYQDVCFLQKINGI